MIMSVVELKVKPLKSLIMQQVWGAQKNLLQNVPGFVSAELFEVQEQERTYAIVTRWESLESLERWRLAAREQGGEHLERMLRGESRIVEPPYRVSRMELLTASCRETLQPNNITGASTENHDNRLRPDNSFLINLLQVFFVGIGKIGAGFAKSFGDKTARSPAGHG